MRLLWKTLRWIVGLPASDDSAGKPFFASQPSQPAFGPRDTRTFRHPPGLRLPKKGQRFRAKHDLKVHVHVWYHAPFSDGRSAMLHGGEVLVLDYEPDTDETGGVSLIPERYEELEKEFVSERMLTQGPYQCYTVGISYVQLDRDFDWLP